MSNFRTNVAILFAIRQFGEGDILRLATGQYSGYKEWGGGGLDQ